MSHDNIERLSALQAGSYLVATMNSVYAVQCLGSAGGSAIIRGGAYFPEYRRAIIGGYVPDFSEAAGSSADVVMGQPMFITPQVESPDGHFAAGRGLIATTAVRRILRVTNATEAEIDRLLSGLSLELEVKPKEASRDYSQLSVIPDDWWRD